MSSAPWVQLFIRTKQSITGTTEATESGRREPPPLPRSTRPRRCAVFPRVQLLSRGSLSAVPHEDRPHRNGGHGTNSLSVVLVEQVQNPQQLMKAGQHYIMLG
ncbi:hypothetical protein EYF80_017676 [Liparis tanakae]|uniref:Uncharacterized protein n=1 Tax=Liparis tanakae TaxID=230148 RepID=A0A4Z2I1Y8_9TELE|nr:hypothetical protein EYF80_017676 [Liparis tanakae]